MVRQDTVLDGQGGERSEEDRAAAVAVRRGAAVPQCQAVDGDIAADDVEEARLPQSVEDRVARPVADDRDRVGDRELAEGDVDRLTVDRGREGDRIGPWV